MPKVSHITLSTHQKDRRIVELLLIETHLCVKTKLVGTDSTMRTKWNDCEKETILRIIAVHKVSEQSRI